MTAARRSSIRVAKTRNHRGRPAWAWHCDIHPRARGFHNTDRWTDYYRRTQGYPPDAHPWARAMDGAIRHWHKYHAECICAVTHRPLVSREPRENTC